MTDNRDGGPTVNGKNTPTADNWRDKLLGWLARREYSQAEAAERLRRAGCPDDLAEQLVQQCTQQRLIDDARCAETRVRSLLMRGYGREYLHRDLQARGIDDSMIEQSLQGQDWQQNARNSLKKRFGDKQVSAREAVRYLCGKGFDDEIAVRTAGLDEMDSGAL